MSLAYCKREALNKENIGVLANMRRASEGPTRFSMKDSNCSAPRPSLVPARPSTSPQVVVQYIDHILQHTLTREERDIKPYAEYMLAQRDINSRMRAILVDWLVDVTLKFRMQSPTLFMTVALIDRYLSSHEVPRTRLQLVGVAALMIVGKYEEIYPPSVKDYVAVCDNAYNKQEILAMESEMLLAFNFDLNKTCSFVFLEFFRQKTNIEDRSFAFCRYLLETALLDVAHLRFSSSLLAAGAIFLVNKIFKREAWPGSLEIASGIPEGAAKACAKEIFDMMGRVESTTLTALKRKFADAAFFEVSKYRIEKVPSYPQV